jgi:hypothetical protein
MRVTKPAKGASPALKRQQGGAAVEFALVVLFFLTLIFGVIELARAMYICNTLQEVTRRAAALATNTDFSDGPAMQRVRERAIFRDSPGFLMFAEPITDAQVNIDYMAITRDGASLAATPIPPGSLPADPARNHEICMSDPHDAGCIRLVRVRICRTGGAQCEPVPYQTIVSLVAIPFPLPESTTITNAETLGRPAGVAP